MKKPTAKFEPLIQTHVSDWLRELWEVEAQHSAMVGSIHKFCIEVPAPKPRRRKPKSTLRPAKRPSQQRS